MFGLDPQSTAMLITGAVCGVVFWGLGFVMGLEAMKGGCRKQLATQVLQTCLFTSLRRVTEILLANGADPSAKDAGGVTPLHQAAWFYTGEEIKNSGQRKHDVFAKLVESGAKVDALDDLGEAPLHKAIENGNSYAVTRLMELGAKQDIPFNTREKRESLGRPLSPEECSLMAYAKLLGNEPVLAALEGTPAQALHTKEP